MNHRAAITGATLTPHGKRDPWHPVDGHSAGLLSRPIARAAFLLEDRQRQSARLDCPRDRQGVKIYVKRLLLTGRPPGAMPRSGSELVSYWQGEGLVGTRAEITDSQKHARALRRQAEHLRKAATER